jgi:hypothetical protein
MPVATILALLQAAAALIPEIATVLPVVEKELSGQAVTAADIATVDAVTASLNAKADALGG